MLVPSAEQVSAGADGAAGSLVPEKDHEVRHVQRLATGRVSLNERVARLPCT
jgi:hypothetical protein